MPPMRWRGRLPRYRAPLLLLRKHNLPASLVGRQKRGEQHLRVLRAFESTNPSSITAPAAPLPSSNLAEPEPIDGWQAWWPSPPAAERQAYKIPDPPTIRRPVSPTASAPILWAAFGEVGGASWSLEISAAFAFAEWKPRTGSEALRQNSVLAESFAVAFIRPHIFEEAGITAKNWEIERVTDSSLWDIESLTPSFRRGEFVEAVLRRTR